MLSECIYKVLMASGVVTSSDACDLSGAIEAAVLEELAKQKPAYTFHLDSTGAAYLRGECVSKEGAPLYAAPIVPPDMVMVPREPTEEMLLAAGSIAFMDELAEDYRRLIAAAEGKSNANVCGLPHGKESK